MRALVVVVALIALAAVAFYAVQSLPPHIEADLKQRASAALVAADLQFANVAVTGRVVTLSGEAPGPMAREEAVKIVQNVWGVASVNDTLSVGEAAMPPVTPQTVTAAAPLAPASAPAATLLAVEPPPTALPTVESAIDPAFAPPEPEPPEAAATPPELSPSEPAPARAPSVVPPPAAAPIPAMIAKGSATALAASLQMAVSPPPAAPPSYRLEAHVEGRRVELQGLVSTPSAARALVTHVRANVRRALVVDTLNVAHSKPDKDWLAVARTGLSQLAHLDTGSLRLDGHSVSMSGRPRSENDRARVLAALNGLPAGYTSTVLLERVPQAAPPPAVVAATPPTIAAAPPTVAAPPPVAVRPTPAQRHARLAAARYRTAPRPVVMARSLSTDCRRRFGDVLPRVAVAFDSGSSRLLSNAVSGLDELARVARACPQARIGLTGHSDTQEAPAGALQLSRARAYAVRAALQERGVAGASIGVAGRGGLRPAFSNATAEGRDNNRRVEFAVW